jgi:hypothetical protein
MRPVKGHYNGSVVVLDEPAPVQHEVEVIVEFPEPTLVSDPAHADPATTAARVRHWEEARARLSHLSTNVSDEVIRQRDLD